MDSFNPLRKHSRRVSLIRNPPLRCSPVRVHRPLTSMCRQRKTLRRSLLGSSGNYSSSVKPPWSHCRRSCTAVLTQQGFPQKSIRTTIPHRPNLRNLNLPRRNRNRKNRRDPECRGSVSCWVQGADLILVLYRAFPCIVVVRVW